jgi:hypothetical protein
VPSVFQTVLAPPETEYSDRYKKGADCPTLYAFLMLGQVKKIAGGDVPSVLHKDVEPWARSMFEISNASVVGINTGSLHVGCWGRGTVPTEVPSVTHRLAEPVVPR